MKSRIIQHTIGFLQSYLVALVPLGFLWLHNWTDVFFPEVALWIGILFILNSLIYSTYFLLITQRDSAIRAIKVELLTSFTLFFLLYFGYICSYESWWFKALYARKLVSLKILIPIWFIVAIYTIKKILFFREQSIIRLVAIKRKFFFIFGILLITNMSYLLYKSSQPEYHDRICDFIYKPNVYYIILDAYPRADTLQQLYGYNNQKFLGKLEELGFTVCNQSCSNYPITSESLPSTLWLKYLPYDSLTNTGKAYSVLDFYRKNPVFKTFKENGYTIVNVCNYACFSTNHPQAINIPSKIIVTTLFSLTFIDKTFFGPFWAKLYIPNISNICGQNLIDQLNIMHTVLDYKSPKFVFLHIISPHDPYYLKADGSLRENNDPELFSSVGHLDTVSALSEKIEILIEHIREQEPYSIIILQSDHGSEITYKDNIRKNGPINASILKERMGILNAFYFPDNIKPHNIPLDLTSVNTFRLVFSALCQKNIDFLEEKIFFSYLNLNGYDAWTNCKLFIYKPSELNSASFPVSKKDI